jgi:hypothetical protein
MPVKDLWMSLYDAAEVLKESRYSVMQRIIRGEIESQLVAGRTVVSREGVQRILDAA